MKSVFDIAILEAAIFANWKLKRPEINLIVGIGMLAIKVVETFALFCRKV